jgi:hypothetical protein
LAIGGFYFLGTAYTGSAISVAAVSARAFLSEIYAVYEARRGGIPLDTERKVRRHFALNLAARVIAEREYAAKSNTRIIGPFVNAVAWKISGIVIAMSNVSMDTANATVTFHNGDDLIDLAIDLVNIDGDWRVAAITPTLGSQDMIARAEGMSAALRGLCKAGSDCIISCQQCMLCACWRACCYAHPSDARVTNRDCCRRA